MKYLLAFVEMLLGLLVCIPFLILLRIEQWFDDNATAPTNKRS